MKKAALAVLATVALASTAYGKGKTFQYEAPREKVFSAALAIVAEEWTLQSVDKETGMVSFRSGTQDCSALITEIAENRTQVTVNTKTARAGLSIGLGIDGKKIQNSFIEKLGDRLGVKGIEAK